MSRHKQKRPAPSAAESSALQPTGDAPQINSDAPINNNAQPINGGAPQNAAAKEHRLAGLDGLRALAVCAVFLFHADLNWARGGYLGVDLFFIISGFLITGLLTREYETQSHIGLKQFYWRRAKRLFPAFWLMTGAVIVAAAIFAPDALQRLKTDALASLFYITNWALLWTKVSYFEAMGRPPLLQHLWSLAIEEQFYIVWAPFIILGLPRLGRKKFAAAAAFLATASALWMGLLAAYTGYPDHGDASRLYFGTDTHAFQLLLGAALGFLWRPNETATAIGSQNITPAPQKYIAFQKFITPLGLTALLALLALFAYMGEETRWLYPWGFLLATLASIMLIMAATHRGSALGGWLDNPVMRWIGERSYGIYLWHWPIFMLTRPGIDLPLHDTTIVFLIRTALTLGISALSYQFIEMPIRRELFDHLWKNLNTPDHQQKALAQSWALVALFALAFGVAGAILAQAPNKSAPAQDVRHALNTTGKINSIASTTPLKPVAPVEALKPVEPLTPVDSAKPGASSVAPVAEETFTGKQLTAIGDSVLLGSSPLLLATLNGADIHATVGWQTADMLNEIRTLVKNNQLRPVVLIHMGTNGYIYEDQLRQILSLLADCKRVIIVNTRVPRRWMIANNELIDRVIPDYHNVVLVNWRDISEGQWDYFVSDGVHLTDSGQRVYIAEIMRAGHLTPDKETGPHSRAVDPATLHAAERADFSETLVRNPQSKAPDAFWMKMAKCETGSHWKNSGHYSGGLGIYTGSWQQWGGQEFAPEPAQATPAQQIEIANRIATQGWTRPDGKFIKPVGYSGWGCLPLVGRPPSDSRYVYTPESVIAQTFHPGERGDVVRDLELMLGLPQDGIYGKRVHQKHLLYLKAKGLPESRANGSTL